MKKEDIRQIFVIIFALSVVSLITSVIMHIIFLGGVEIPSDANIYPAYKGSRGNFVACTIFSLLAIITLIAMMFYKHIKNEKVKEVLNILSLSCVLLFNIIALCVARYAMIYPVQAENFTILLTNAISCATLVLGYIGIKVVNKQIEGQKLEEKQEVEKSDEENNLEINIENEEK
ncbi:MAG: hypothetical protein J6C53_02415 [Clostridia bacterium]|nr:hypothetical protein [Clostridia bacterium]